MDRRRESLYVAIFHAFFVLVVLMFFKVALDQYNEIISSADAWAIADDEIPSDESGGALSRELKPTVSARRLKALVEQVTDRYSPLPQFALRTRFLIQVQLPLLELYHARVSASLDAFETLAGALVRAVPGALGGGDRGRNAHLTSGAEGVTRLCKALVSARWMTAAMEAWGEDLVCSHPFFSPCAIQILNSVGLIPVLPRALGRDKQ
jgi:RAD50-interacting protein 1